MSDLDLEALVLSWITTYGSPMVGLVLLLGALGIPVPGTLIVIASGAFIRQSFLNPYTTPVLALGGAVAGDIVIYGAGRFARIWIQKRFGNSVAWQKAQNFFERRGGLAIYLTRWLVTPIAVPVNLIAGGSGYPFLKLLFFDVAGEVTWLGLYGGLGYAFGSQWELISQFIADFSGLIVGALILGTGLFLLIRFRKRGEPNTRKVVAVSKKV